MRTAICLLLAALLVASPEEASASSYEWVDDFYPTSFPVGETWVDARRGAIGAACSVLDSSVDAKFAFYWVNRHTVKGVVKAALDSGRVGVARHRKGIR